MCYGTTTLSAEQILSTYEFAASVLYVIQILIVVLLKCEVDPCPDCGFDHWPFW